MAKVWVAFLSFLAEGFSFRNFKGGEVFFTFLLLPLLLGALNRLNDMKDIIFFLVLGCPPSKSLAPSGAALPGFCNTRSSQMSGQLNYFPFIFLPASRLCFLGLYGLKGTSVEPQDFQNSCSFSPRGNKQEGPLTVQQLCIFTDYLFFGKLLYMLHIFYF